MSLKPQPPRPMPPELAAWGAAHLPATSPYRLVGDTLYDQYHDEDFADLYHPEGKPALSPVLLALVTAFQHFENLSDRRAAMMVRTRLDWKYALHLPLDDAGFDASVLCEFRQRLLAHGAEARVFDQVLDHMKALGLITARGSQRTDSLALLSRARDLGRRELVFETIRVVLRALLAADADWLRATIPTDWVVRYQKHCRDERHSDAERAALDATLGADVQWLLARLAAAETPSMLRDLPTCALLQTVWDRHFVLDGDTVQWRTPGTATDAPPLETPYDPEARWSQKRNKGWVGYKLQVTETDDANQPHLITDIAVTPSSADDRTALASIAERQDQRDVLPGTRYVDQGYVCGPTLTDADARDEDLVGPAPQAHSPQHRLPEGLTHADFQIDVAQRTAICPAGHPGTPKEFVGHQDSGDKGITFTFQQRHCQPCTLRDRCLTGKKIRRYLVVRATYTRLEQARARQQTEAFKDAYAQHRPGIEGCLSALVRGQGIRHCRYAGQAKNHLRALFVGAAVNLDRAAAWLAGKRHRPKRQGLALAAATSG